MKDLVLDEGTRHISIWSSPGRGLWVASDGHFYRGMIERSEGEFIATDGHGRSTGHFATLEAAKLSIDDSPIHAVEVMVGA